MPAPYDYTIGEVASPQQSFLQGIQMVDALRKREQDQAAAIEAKRKEQELQALYAEALKPDATPDVFERLQFAIDPQKAAFTKFQQRSDAQQDAMIGNMGSVLTPLVAGKPDLAIQRADELIKAMENSPNPDQKSLQALKASRQVFNQSPELAQVSLTTSMMGLGEKGRKAVNDIFDALKKPVEQRKAAGEAAKFASEAEKAAIDVKYLEREKIAGLKKQAADSGLTQANINRVLAETRKLSAEAAGAALELEALKRGGGIPPAKAFEQEEKLRKEYRTRTQTYQDLSSTFSNLKASAKIGSGPGDIALITGFMKMLDPGSVVRETEFATARDTAGLYANLQNRLEKAKNGQFLKQEQRQEYIALSQKYFDAAQSKAKQDKNALELVVKNYKLNPENVFGEPSSSPVPAAQQRNVVVSY